MCRAGFRSKKKKMDEFQQLKSVFVLFFVFGQALYFPINSTRPVLISIFIKFTPLLVHIGFLAFTAYSVIVNTHHMIDNPSNEDSVAMITITAISLMPSISVFFHNFANPNTAFRIFNGFRYIFAYMKVEINGTFCVNVFRREYFTKIAISIFIHILTFIVRFTINTNRNMIITVAGVFVMQTYKLWTKMHALFYVDLVKFTISAINEETLNIHCGSMLISVNGFHCKSVRAKLHHLKFIHLKLWYLVRGVNSQFEWSLIGILLDTTVYGISSAYWTFLASASKTGSDELILRN